MATCRETAREALHRSRCRPNAPQTWTPLATFWSKGHQRAASRAPALRAPHGACGRILARVCGVRVTAQSPHLLQRCTYIFCIFLGPRLPAAGAAGARGARLQPLSPLCRRLNIVRVFACIGGCWAACEALVVGAFLRGLRVWLCSSPARDLGARGRRGGAPQGGVARLR